MTTRRFTHDCDLCDFLGHFWRHDVYFCARRPGTMNRHGSWIARFGNDGPDYSSMPSDVLLTHLRNADTSHLGGPIDTTDDSILKQPFLLALMRGAAITHLTEYTEL